MSYSDLTEADPNSPLSRKELMKLYLGRGMLWLSGGVPCIVFLNAPWSLVALGATIEFVSWFVLKYKEGLE